MPATARYCALDVVHLWDAPDVVVRYLKTGDETLRGAAAADAAAAYAAYADAATSAYTYAADAIKQRQSRRLRNMIACYAKEEI